MYSWVSCGHIKGKINDALFITVGYKEVKGMVREAGYIEEASQKRTVSHFELSVCSIDDIY